MLVPAVLIGDVLARHAQIAGKSDRHDAFVEKLAADVLEAMNGLKALILERQAAPSQTTTVNVALLQPELSAIREELRALRDTKALSQPSNENMLPILSAISDQVGHLRTSLTPGSVVRVKKGAA